MGGVVLLSFSGWLSRPYELIYIYTPNDSIFNYGRLTIEVDYRKARTVSEINPTGYIHPY